MPYSMQIHRSAVTTHTMTVTGGEIIAALNGNAPSLLPPIPTDAAVFFDVPGGGDWSSTDIEIDEQHPIRIVWVTREETDS